MTDINISFCQLMLKTFRADCKKAKVILPKLKKCSTYHFGGNHWEFQAPGFYWHGSADNGYDARYKGLSAWVEANDKRGAKRLAKLYEDKKS